MYDSIDESGVVDRVCLWDVVSFVLDDDGAWFIGRGANCRISDAVLRGIMTWILDLDGESKA